MTDYSPAIGVSAARTRNWPRLAVRWLFLTHRYLGIAVSLLMVVWCLSGIVMMYVSFPRLPETVRVAALAPIDLRECCTAGATDSAVGSDTAVDDVRVEELAGRPVADIRDSHGPRILVDLRTGEAIRSVTAEQAKAVASLFGQQQGLPSRWSSRTTLDFDQWTTSEHFDGERPLYKFSWPDRQASALYVSSASGKAMQFTTAPVRFWNWVGAVPHWVYFTSLRKHEYIWAQFIIYSSIVGCFLTATGLYIGVRQFMRRPATRISPYRGFMWWHHIPGVIFGIVLLTWVMSGLFSMTPWGFLDGGSATEERRRLSGSPMLWRDLRSSLVALSVGDTSAGIVSIQSDPLDGHLYWIETHRDGSRARFDDRGMPVALSGADLEREAQLLGGRTQSPPQLMQGADQFYFSHHSTPASFPVYRVVLSEGEKTRYYLDPVSGEIVKKVDASARGYRWLHEGLHRLDFVAIIRTRPVWDVLMVTLLLGASLVSATGLYSAFLRVSGRPRSSRLPSRERLP
jgi:uncharacterized iron-regulated membrane protein